MKEPNWLSPKLILGLQNESIAKFGGSSGLRDQGLLESALARPKNLFVYENPDIFRMAASYGFGLVKNHPFVDGNKRIAFLACAVFLMDNGWEPIANEVDVVHTIEALASGELEEHQFSQWLKNQFKANSA